MKRLGHSIHYLRYSSLEEIMKYIFHVWVKRITKSFAETCVYIILLATHTHERTQKPVLYFERS